MRPYTLIFLCVSLLSLGCSDPASPDRGVTGVWRLESANGVPLPVTLPDQAVDKVEVTAEVITLLESGRLTLSTSFRVTDRGVVRLETIPDAGSYTWDGSKLVLTWESDGSTSEATVRGDLLTLDDGWVYRRD